MRLTYGVGINDAGYKTQDIPAGWFCPFFLTWRNMLRRVYHPAFIAQRPSYAGVSVCESWLTFSNFRSWMESHNWQGRQLDKDLLSPGNKEYAPDKCCFLTSAVNTFLCDRSLDRGDYPLGVYLRADTRKFSAQINRSVKKFNLGSFSNPEDAHAAWLAAKIDEAERIALAEPNFAIAAALVSMYRDGGYLARSRSAV